MSVPADALGVTLVVPEGVDPVGVYDDDGGLPTFESNAPYTLSDGVTMQQPVPIFYPGGTMYRDRAGNLAQSLAIRGVTPPDPEGIAWDSNTTWDNGTYWS